MKHEENTRGGTPEFTNDGWLKQPTAAIPEGVKGLIFDLDGTLIDTMAVHYHAWLSALEGTGIIFPEARFYAMAGAPTQKIAAILCAEYGRSDGEVLARRKEDNFLTRLPEMLPVLPVQALAQREAGRRKLAVASGGSRAVVERELAVIGMADFFPVVVCSDDVRHGKPAPDTFLEAARRMGLRPEECAVYEDADLGFQAAQAARMYVVDVQPWYQPRKGGG